MSTEARTSTERMSATREPEAPFQVASFRTLSEHDRRAIIAVIEAKIRLKLAQAQVREDVKALADRLAMKPAELNRIVRLATQERERGNVLIHEKALIELAEQVVL